jgi:signal transduction histidine kinase
LQASWKLIGDPWRPEVEWDSHHIGSAMLEMVRNAQQAADPAIVEIEIAGFERNGVEWVRIVCQDTGPGIPADLKETIFKDFFSRKSQEHAGTGLGLWYVRRVADAHGGSVEETGAPGAGARFVIELPRRVSGTK